MHNAMKARIILTNRPNLYHYNSIKTIIIFYVFNVSISQDF